MTVTTVQPLQQHPLSAAFPAMPDEEIDALAEDIKKNGQRDPGVTLDGMVLDGWHRYIACTKAGVKFYARPFDGEDPVSYVKSKNWHRRHLTASQKAATEVALREWRPRGGRQSAIVADSFSTEAMAQEAGVSPRTIEHAKAAERAGLGQAVRDGEVSAARASEIAKLPKNKRAKALKEPATPKAKPDDGELRALKAKYDDLQDRYETLADTAREVQDKLEAFENTDPDEQQKAIMRLQKLLQRKDQEIARLTAARNDAQAKCNELIREVKRLKRKAGE